ncbi:hypothetical protein [Amycolatopsis sp. FDAARGOS 1241]|uniref:hypothetical protein n=1 Tax=Amycolatopsis sp. FDAARGOS 1241 TaxID=2778070 RepID=UPI00194FFE56|nr:hypothetical protein [Amycolatopsis sp. FDAARGOS 1241]QRP44684.1 hypothetical protein I6J71_36430 [Amycolatopsis sp. FDAARGOS 1241]
MDRCRNRVTKVILQSREQHRRLPLEEVVVKTAVKSVWNLLQPRTWFGVLTGFKNDLLR